MIERSDSNNCERHSFFFSSYVGLLVLTYVLYKLYRRHHEAAIYSKSMFVLVIVVTGRECVFSAVFVLF